MTRPTPARLADLTRTGAWSFLTWCFVEGHLRPDLDLLLAKNPGDLYQQWTARHPDDVARIAQVAERFGWSSTWTTDVSRGGLSLLCLTAGKTLDELTDDDFDTFADALAQAPSAGHHTWTHNSARLFSLHQACYELRICQRPPRKARPGKASHRPAHAGHPAADHPQGRAALPDHGGGHPATEHRRVARRQPDHLRRVSGRPTTRNVRSLAQLSRQHMEDFLAYNHGRPWRGRVARDQPVSPTVSKRTVIDLRCFFDDLALWGWAERPPGRLLFAGDIPRLDKPLPRALPPDVDRDLMAAIGRAAPTRSPASG